MSSEALPPSEMELGDMNAVKVSRQGIDEVTTGHWHMQH